MQMMVIPPDHVLNQIAICVIVKYTEVNENENIYNMGDCKYRNMK